MKRKVKKTERGWAGHFCCSDSCSFRRNTLLECNQIKIVVSTVGLMRLGLQGEQKIEQIGYKRYYGTMAFHSLKDDQRYHDADVRQQVNFESPWNIDSIDADDKTNDMHEIVVGEITIRLERGETFKPREEE